MTKIFQIPANSREPLMNQAAYSASIAGATKSKPYSNYQFRAVIDWISLRIVTLHPTNFDTVRRRMGIPFVDPMNEGPGKAATEFIVRIQEPTSWFDLRQTVEKFTRDHPLANPIEVTGIEIALDAYSRNQDRDELVDMVARFYKFSATVVSDNRRTSGAGKRSSQGMTTYRALRERVKNGFNIYIGEDTDPVKQHMYVKETNHCDNVTVSLPSVECRARTEFTLTGSEFPHTALSDWEEHEFTADAAFFKYRKLKERINAFIGYALTHIAQVGQKRTRKRACGGTRLYSVNTVADKVLNDLAYSALRELTRRMKG